MINNDKNQNQSIHESDYNSFKISGIKAVCLVITKHLNLKGI